MWTKQVAQRMALIFNKSVDVVLCTMFTCGNLENISKTQQGFLCFPVGHHLKQKKNAKKTKMISLEKQTDLGGTITKLMYIPKILSLSINNNWPR